MQILKIYTIRDNKAEFYANPFYARSNGEAMRMFENALTDTQSPMSQSPQDYALFELGTYSDEDAKIVALESKNHLYDGADAVRNNKNENVVTLDKQKKKV